MNHQSTALHHTQQSSGFPTNPQQPSSSTTTLLQNPMTAVSSTNPHPPPTRSTTTAQPIVSNSGGYGSGALSNNNIYYPTTVSNTSSSPFATTLNFQQQHHQQTSNFGCHNPSSVALGQQPQTYQQHQQHQQQHFRNHMSGMNNSYHHGSTVVAGSAGTMNKHHHHQYTNTNNNNIMMNNMNQLLNNDNQSSYNNTTTTTNAPSMLHHQPNMMGNQFSDANSQHVNNNSSNLVDSMITNPHVQLNNQQTAPNNENLFSVNTFFRHANSDILSSRSSTPSNRVQNSTSNSTITTPTMVNFQNNAPPQHPKWSQSGHPTLIQSESNQQNFDQHNNKETDSQGAYQKGGIKITRNIRADTCATPSEPVEYPKHGILYIYNVENWTDKNSFYDKIAYSFGTPSTQKKVHCSYLNCKVMHYERTCQGVYYCPHKDDDDTDGIPCIVRPCRLRFHTCQKHNNNSLTKSGKCPFKLHFYVPLDKSDHRRLLLCLGTHNHPLLSESDCTNTASQATEKKAKQSKASNNQQTSVKESKPSNVAQPSSSIQEQKQSISRVSSTNSIQAIKLESSMTNLNPNMMNVIPSGSTTSVNENIPTTHKVMNYNQNPNPNFMVNNMNCMPTDISNNVMANSSMPTNMMSTSNVVNNMPVSIPSQNTLMNNMNGPPNSTILTPPQKVIGTSMNILSSHQQHYPSASEALMNPPPKQTTFSLNNTSYIPPIVYRSASQEILGSTSITTTTTGLIPTRSSPLGRSPSLSPPYSYSSPHTPTSSDLLPSKPVTQSILYHPQSTMSSATTSTTPGSSFSSSIILPSTKKLPSLFQPSDYLQHVSKPPSYSKTPSDQQQYESKRPPTSSSLVSSSPNFMSSSSPSLYSFSTSPSPQRVELARSPSYHTNPSNMMMMTTTTTPSPPHMLVSSPMNPVFPALSPSYFCDNNFPYSSSPQQQPTISQSPNHQQIIYKTEPPTVIKRERVYSSDIATTTPKKVKQEDSVLPPIGSIVD